MKAALSLSKKQHKNITALFLAMVLMCTLMVPMGRVWGQGLENYTFTTGTGGTTYSPTWTQLIASGEDDEVSSLTSIGFTFKYDGVDYTQFSVNSNGNLRLGSSVIASGGYSTPFGGRH